MALVKLKPTSPGRRSVVRLINKDLHKGEPYKNLIEKLLKRPAATIMDELQQDIVVVAINSIID